MEWSIHYHSELREHFDNFFRNGYWIAQNREEQEKIILKTNRRILRKNEQLDNSNGQKPINGPLPNDLKADRNKMQTILALGKSGICIHVVRFRLVLKLTILIRQGQKKTRRWMKDSLVESSNDNRTSLIYIKSCFLSNSF